MRRPACSPIALRLACAALAVAAGLPLAAPTAAADEKELTLALSPAFAVATVDPSTAYGGGLGLDAGYGVSDALALHATGFASVHGLETLTDARSHRVTEQGGALVAFYAGLGLTYTIDILRVVPSVDLSVGVLGLALPSGETSYRPGVEVGVAVDYLYSRRLSFGVVVRYHAALTAFSTIPVYLYAGPRIALHFGG